jgi:hypothetical protein
MKTWYKITKTSVATIYGEPPKTPYDANVALSLPGLHAVDSFRVETDTPNGPSVSAFPEPKRS